MSADYLSFAKELKEGQTYDFPEVILNFEQKLGRELKDPRTKQGTEKVIIRKR